MVIKMLVFAEKENGPKTVKDVKLISAGRILDNNKTVGDCRSPVSNLSVAVTTMHVLIQPQATEKGKALQNNSLILDQIFILCLRTFVLLMLIVMSRKEEEEEA